MRLRNALLVASLTLLLTMMASMFGSRPAVAHPYGIIRIQSDGTIYPQTAPVQRIGDTYFLTANVTSNDYGIDIERNNTIFDGASNTVKGAGFDWGIFVGAYNVTVKNTRVEGFGQGIMVRFKYNVVIGNCITLNDAGVYITQDFRNTIVGNNISDNIEGVYLSSCEENVVTGNNIGGNEVGIYLDNAWHNTISGNNIEKNELDGIYALQGFGQWPNRIFANNIRDNGQFGIQLDGISEGNCIYHNNFINNTSGHAFPGGWNNTWFQDYPCCGNYWSNYVGDDLHNGSYQNLTGSDGIGDSPHSIYGSLTDDYPLMGMFSSFNTSLGYSVDVVSDSTMEDFTYFESNNTVTLHVSSMTAGQTRGFCRLTIPHVLLSPPYTITINGTQVSYTPIFENETLSIIYFSYGHSTTEIIIIPEFSSFLTLPLFMIATLLAATIFRRSARRRSIDGE